MESKLNRMLCYEDFQYASGDIVVTGESDELHLYEVVDSVSHSKNLFRENFIFRKKKHFLNVHGKKI